MAKSKHFRWTLERGFEKMEGPINAAEIHQSPKKSFKWTLEGGFEKTSKTEVEKLQKVNKSNHNYKCAPKSPISFKEENLWFHCKICNASFITKQNLDIHISTNHEGKSDL